MTTNIVYIVYALLIQCLLSRVLTLGFVRISVEQNSVKCRPSTRANCAVILVLIFVFLVVFYLELLGSVITLS